MRRVVAPIVSATELDVRKRVGVPQLLMMRDAGKRERYVKTERARGEYYRQEVKRRR